jgi:hypothetical protein
MTWRPPDREDRQVAALWAVCAGLAILLRPLWLAGAGVLPRCAWHAWTGWPCPGCGTTRAIVHLLHADPGGALAMNPLSTCGAVVFVGGGLAAPVWLAFGGCAPSVTFRPRALWSAAVAIVLLANWGWLVATGV